MAREGLTSTSAVVGKFQTEVTEGIYIEGSDDGGSFWYVKLHNHFRVSFFQKINASFILKQKSELIGNGLFDSSQLSQNFIWKN